MMLIITHLMIITDDDDNDSVLHIADLLLLIDKNEKHIVDMSTINFWNNSCQCYLTLMTFGVTQCWMTMVTMMAMMTQVTIDDDK